MADVSIEDIPVSIQVCERRWGQNKCPFHPGQEVTTKCKNCDILVCFECITETLHEGHTFKKFKDCLRESTDNLHTEIRKLKTQITQDVKKDLKSSGVHFKERQQRHLNDIRHVESQRNEIVTEANVLAASFIKKLKNDFEAETRAHTQRKSQLNSLQADVQGKINEYEKILDKGTEFEIHDTGAAISNQKPLLLPDPLDCAQTQYILNNRYKEHVNKAMGCLEDLKDNVFEQCSETETVSLKKLNIKVDSDNQCMYQSTQNVATLDNTTVRYYSICPISKDTAWAGEYDYMEAEDKYRVDKNLRLITNTGQVLKKIQTPSLFEPLVFNHKTNKLYGGFYARNTVRLINTETGTLTTVVECPCRPDRLLITHDDHILVGTFTAKEDNNHIYKYTLDGKLVMISSERFEAWDINQCPMTSRIVVSCGEAGVVVLEKDLCRVSTYMGIPSGDLSDSDKEFWPFTSAFDPQGNLVIGDYDNIVKLHIVDGQKMTLIQGIKQSDLSKPWQFRYFNDILWFTGRHPEKIMCIKIL